MDFVEYIRTPRLDGVTLYRQFLPPVDGTLCVTGHHLILSSRKTQAEELWLLHSNIDSVEKKLATSGNGGIIKIKCKDFQIMQLDIPLAEDCLNIYNSIEQLSNLEKISLSYAFFYQPVFNIIEEGWTAFLPETEFNRVKTCSDGWRLSLINRTFEVCSSYPQSLVVPNAIDDETLRTVAMFRHKGRFPVLSYLHKENSAVVMRSSHLISGQNIRKCKEDERLLNCALVPGHRGYIIDTRSSNISKSTASKGAAVDFELQYSQWRKLNHRIERPAVLHESLSKLMEACLDVNCSMDKWLSRLDACGWLHHVKDVLTCACVAAQCVDKENCSVLVNGAEGTDATLQVTSLTQIILDHDCRTIRGFEALIEREWLQAGHPFASRCAKSAFSSTKHRQESPVFLLFLDSVFQIWNQFPCSFEFNEKFLITIFQHSYASQFGTFFCNNSFERSVNNLSSDTISIWSYINQPHVLEDFLNPLYEPCPLSIWPSVAPQSIVLWCGLFQRFERQQIIQDDIWQNIKEIKEKDKFLTAKAIRLRKRLICLEKEALDKGLVEPPTEEFLQSINLES